MAETLANDVYKLLISRCVSLILKISLYANLTCFGVSGSKGWVKKKAALTLLRLFRKHPDIIPVQDWAERVMNIIDDADIVRRLIVLEATLTNL